MRKYITKASERIGVESTSRDGKRAQVVSYSTCENFIIRFCDGKEMKLKNWRYFIEGNFNYEKHFKAPRNGEIVYHKCYQSFVKGNISHPKDTSLAKKNQRLNIRKQMKNGMMAEVIEYNLSNDIKVKFDNGEIVKTRWERFSTGSVAVPSCYARNHIGDKKIQNRGNEEAEIIEVKDANHITVKFKDGTIVKDRKYEDFIHGAIGKPGIPQLRRTLKNERLWTEKIMRNGMKAKIVRYGSANDIDIKFSNGTIVMHKTYANFCSGSVACK